MQFAVVLDRAPILVLGGDQDVGRGLYFGKIGAHGFDDGQDLVRMNAPHAQVAEFAAGAQRIVTMYSMSFSSVVTLCDGTMPLARAAAVISHLARATSG